MSSGEDWTHHWLMTSMGPSRIETLADEAPIHSTDHPAEAFDGQLQPDESLDDPLGMSQIQAPNECITTSPVTSIDLDRDSPMACGIDEDDTGPPSIETQPPDNSDLEVSGITSWINSGGHYSGSHAGLGYPPLSSDLVGTSSNHSGINQLPELETGDLEADFPPVYGPSLPVGPFSSPVRNTSPLNFGDVTDESATSGLCGLRNLGNTCFMAAGLQCLVNTPPIAQYFFNHHLESEEAKRSLAGCFSQLTHKIWSGKYSSLRPSEFKEAFGAHWRDFRDYRQHDCQEFMTLLLEALRKQMPLREEPLQPQLQDRFQESIQGHSHKFHETASSGLYRSSCASSASSRSSSQRGGSRGSLSPSPSQSPQGPPSPLSPEAMKQPSFETRSETQEDPVFLDSGAASPKSSVSSSSVDAHLISLRLHPIPEEVKTLARAIRINTSTDDISLSGTMSCHDAESVTSDISDCGDTTGIAGSLGAPSGISCIPSGVSGMAGVSAVRRYNHLSDCDNLSNSSPQSLPEAICDNCSAEGETHMEPCISYIPSEEQPHLVIPHNPSEMDCYLTSSNSVSEESQHSLNVIPDSRSEPTLQHHDSTLQPNFEPNLGSLSMVKLEDIMKETKTSNINVLAKDNVPNNEFLYDSEKYAKFESKKLKNSLDNFRGGLKRVKEVNILAEKMDNSQMDTCLTKTGRSAKYLPGRNSVVALNKRIRLEEKNVQYEKNQADFYDRMGEGVSSPSTPYSDRSRGNVLCPPKSSEEHRLAEEAWKRFVGDSKSAVVDTFYGQFKSSLVCLVCGHTSITFDPFGTLSVPLPHANEIQIPIIYMPADGGTPVRYLITLFKISTVQELKAALLQRLPPSDNTIVIAEVFDNHIARIVEETYLTRFLNFSLRSIYAFELAPFPHFQGKDSNSSGQSKVAEEDPESDVESCSGAEASCSAEAEWQACNICLEELCQTELKTHESCDDCVLCDNCIEMSCKHHGGKVLACPVCHAHLKPADLIPVAKRKAQKPKARILRVPIVFRVDTESDDNNKREMQLIGHPVLLTLPSRIHSLELTDIIEKKLPKDALFSLLLVDGRGYNCSRCLFSSHCRGCEASKGGSEIVLQAGDTLCVRLRGADAPLNLREELGARKDDPSMGAVRPNEPLTLYDCLRAFTQSEMLEESESWYCPKCERKQQATKTISVWKYPPYLIIHLERFLFHGTVSTKVDDKVLFPIDGLDLSDFVSGDQQTPLLYNLYSVVCHMGVAQAGHYTALVRSPMTGEWHYFNDDTVTRQKPRDEEYSTSYLLFYHRQGTKFDLCLPKNKVGTPKTRVSPISGGAGYVSATSKSNDGALPSVSSIVSPLPQLPSDSMCSLDKPGTSTQAEHFDKD